MVKKLSCRRTGGQGLVECAAGLVVISLVFILLVAFSFNAYTTKTYSEKMKFVANAVSATYADKYFFIGMQRPDFDKNQAEASVKNMANYMLQSLGLPAASNISVVPVISPRADIIYAETTITIDGLKLPFGSIRGLFPSPFSLTITGRGARVASCPYAAFVADVQGPGGKHLRAAVPCYGFKYAEDNPEILRDVPIGNWGPLTGDVFVSDATALEPSKADELLWKLTIDDTGHEQTPITIPYLPN